MAEFFERVENSQQAAGDVPVPGHIEFRQKVTLIHHHPGACPAESPGKQEIHVRRLTELNHIDSLTDKNASRNSGCHEEGVAILYQVTSQPAAIRRRRVLIEAYGRHVPIDAVVWMRLSDCLHRVPTLDQAVDLFTNAIVQAGGTVLDNN